MTIGALSSSLPFFPEEALLKSSGEHHGAITSSHLLKRLRHCISTASCSRRGQHCSLLAIAVCKFSTVICLILMWVNCGLGNISTAVWNLNRLRNNLFASQKPCFGISLVSFRIIITKKDCGEISFQLVSNPRIINKASFWRRVQFPRSLSYILLHPGS